MLQIHQITISNISMIDGISIRVRQPVKCSPAARRQMQGTRERQEGKKREMEKLRNGESFKTVFPQPRSEKEREREIRKSLFMASAVEGMHSVPGVSGVKWSVFHQYNLFRSN